MSESLADQVVDPVKRARPSPGGSRKGIAVLAAGLLGASLAAVVASSLLAASDDEARLQTQLQHRIDGSLQQVEAALGRLEARQTQDEARLQRLDNRLEATGTVVDASTTGLSEAQERLHGVNDRLTELEKGLVQLDDGLHLRVTAQNERIEMLVAKLEALAEARRTAPSPSTPARRSARRATPSSPSFQVTGVESRGGRSYVGVSPKGASSLRDIKLLGIGDRQDGWEVAAIRGSHAVFVRNGRDVNVSIP